MTIVSWTYRSMDGNRQVDFGGVSEVYCYQDMNQTLASAGEVKNMKNGDRQRCNVNVTGEFYVDLSLR